MTLHDLAARLADWHRAKYGDRPVQFDRTVLKLYEEFGELALALECSPSEFATEAADVVIVLFHLVRGRGVSLAAAIERKLAVIEERLTNPNAGREVHHG